MLDFVNFQALVRSVSMGFITLNIINFADMVRKENNRVLWDVWRVSSP